MKTTVARHTLIIRKRSKYHPKGNYIDYQRGGPAHCSYVRVVWRRTQKGA